MFRIEFKAGKDAGRVKEYKSIVYADRQVFRNLYDHPLHYKIRDWMRAVDGTNKGHNLTVENTIRIEYVPN